MVMTAEHYLKENIDHKLSIKTWLKTKDLPVILRDIYNFYEMTILGTRCVVLEVVNEKPTIDQLQKHIGQIKKLTDYHIILFYKGLSRYRRKSLIDHKIAFVIADGQMYLPFLAIDFKKAEEHIEEEMKSFTTPAQIAYLYFLYDKELIVNTSEFAQKFGFNKMTASRALNDLYQATLITYEIGGKTGRSKEYRRIPDPAYFLRGRDYLKTPVRKVIYTKNKPSTAFSAGLEALADLSMINPPSHPVLAIDRNTLKIEQLEIITNQDLIKDENLVELELWDYNPGMFTNKPQVDLLSLYASLRDNTDERVEQALEEILRGEPWYYELRY